jgi:hypothetical protein
MHIISFYYIRFFLKKTEMAERTYTGIVRRRGEKVQRGEPVARGVLPDAEADREPDQGDGPVQVPGPREQPLQRAVPHDQLDAAGPPRAAPRHELLPRGLDRHGGVAVEQHADPWQQKL